MGVNRAKCRWTEEQKEALFGFNSTQGGLSFLPHLRINLLEILMREHEIDAVLPEGPARYYCA